MDRIFLLMVDLQVSKQFSQITIESYKGAYNVHLINSIADHLKKMATEKTFFIIDKNVYQIYNSQFSPAFINSKILIIEANESNKDLNCFSEYISKLAELGIKRDHTLVAIGGGVIQDITCFIASTLFRGMNWVFYPTTLLAQADSCIGSKSSINVAGIKNLLGTFTPPREIFIALDFLKTLEVKEIFSGIGEMIKVHGIAGIKALEDFNSNYDKIINEPGVLKEYIYKSLLIKKNIIEIDEFDTGIRNIMNYGHTFGHAIESASHYGIPHGIAVTIGQAMACRYSFEKKFISEKIYNIANTLLLKNFYTSRDVKIQFSIFLSSIKKDKKNIGSQIAVIIPINDNFKIEKMLINADDLFVNYCTNYFINNGFIMYE